MIIISENIGNLIKNIPKAVLTKLNVSMSNFNKVADTIELIIICFNRQKAEQMIISIGGTFFDLGYNYAIINISTDKLSVVASDPSIQYIEFSKALYFNDNESNEASCIQKARTTYKLDGTGALIGFIDSGIDYTHPAFIDDAGNTRIKYIYNLSLGADKVYTEEEINSAIKSTDPYSIVPVYDDTGHGTHVAGIAAAGGNINREYYGVAPKASIIMVKTARGYYSLSTSIMKGIKFLVDKSLELNMPLVINMSLSTNDGAHDGKSLLEQYIYTIGNLNRITMVIAAGNEGNTAHHIGGKLEKNTVVKFSVSPGEFNIVINLFKSILPIVSISLISPAGKSSGAVIVEEGYKEGVISGNKYQIYDSGPKPFDIIGEIGISLNNNGREILSGLWTIEIKILNEYVGEYDMWLPTDEGLNKETRFLNPTVDNTLGIPATVYNVISVGSYSYKTRTLSPFSGRGKVNNIDDIQPTIVAPGNCIYAPVPENSYDNKAGTSMATPHVSGAAALMMEWGIVKGNDPYLYGERLKHYIILGARRQRKDIIYPDNSWGYGELCLYDSIEKLSDILEIIIGEEYREKNNVLMNRDTININDYDSYTDYLNEIINNSNEIVSLIFQYSSEEQLEKVKQIENTSVLEMTGSYAIAYTPLNKIKEIEKIVQKVFFNQQEALFTLAEISPIEASDVSSYQDSKLLDLTGRGVIIGIIDTGIDYLSKEFQREDGLTRIVSIWDQSLEATEPVMGINIGKEFTMDQINEAIKASNEGKDPYAIVESKDTDGHGTEVASIAAARGINKQVRGVAYDSNIAVVKLRKEGIDRLKVAGVTKDNAIAYNDVNIISAMIYLQRVARTEQKPLVMILALETNTGPHDGTDPLCESIDLFTSQLGILMVTGTGNEGDKETHTAGFIGNSNQTTTIELMAGKNQNAIAFSIWVKRPNIFAISVISPSGEAIDKIPIKVSQEQGIKFTFEKTLMGIKYILSSEQNGCEVIYINAIGLKPGIWRFKLYGEYVVDGVYSSWLPQASLLSEGTKFVTSNESTTLSASATAKKVVAVAYYNQNNNSIIASSGRGYTWDDRIKPDIAAGGINAKVIKPGDTVATVSGSSVATGIVGGICALILQWGIVEKNDPNIYEESILSYIIRGAKIRQGDNYPNPEWGYGMINVDNIFEIIRGNYRESDEYEEYNIGNLFIRKPVIN